MVSFVRPSIKASAAFALSAGVVIAPIVSMTNLAWAQSATFKDVEADYWAKPFIERLAQEDIIAGFPDGSFKPNQPVTRAQFAAIVRKAFKETVVRNSRDFSDIPNKYWATSAIDKAYTTGFMSGYPDGTFQPEQKIPKVQALVSISSGLNLAPSGSIENTLDVFRDGGEIPDYARKGVAAATQRNLVVNYPNKSFLNPNEVATRADIAAFVYQALVNKQEFKALPLRSDAAAYIVTYKSGSAPATNPTTPPPLASEGIVVARNTVLPVQYAGGNDVKLIITPGETLAANLETSANVLDPQGSVLIPRGSLVEGQFRPVSINGTTQGTQYYTQQITVKGKEIPILATSDPFIATNPQTLSENTLKGGLASAAAQILLGRVLGGGFNLGNLLGTLGGNAASVPQTANTVIVVEPKKMTLRVQNAFRVAAQPTKYIARKLLMR